MTKNSAEVVQTQFPMYNNNITTHENLFLVFHDWIIILLYNIVMYNTKFWF